MDLLIKTQRVSEAAMFARTYVPSKMPEAVSAWRDDLTSKKRGKLASAIADPAENPELFPETQNTTKSPQLVAELSQPLSLDGAWLDLLVVRSF